MGILDAPFIARKRNVMIALGTSITEGGWVGGDPNRWTAKLPASLTALLPGASITVINAGVSGNTSADMLSRLPAVLANNPGAGLVFMETSVNDFKTAGGLTIAQSEANMRSMIAQCELAGCRVIIGTSSPFTITSGFSWSKQIEGNKMAARVATERGLPLVDLFNPLTDLAAYQTADGLHPNTSGNQVWADNIAKVIAALQTGVQPEPLGTNVVIDRFTRSDNASSLGSAPTGQAWTAAQGTWGIADGKAYESGGVSNSAALVNSGLTNQVVTGVMSVAEGTGLVARSDAAGMNYYMVNVFAGAIYKKVAGSFTPIGTAAPAGTFVNGDTVSLEVNGSAITVKRNGAVVATATDTAVTTGTYSGLWRSGANIGRWDKFTVN